MLLNGLISEVSDDLTRSSYLVSEQNFQITDLIITNGNWAA
jgi:hypothetical protein